MTELGRSVNELELNLLEGVTGGLGNDALSESENPLLDSGGGALDHEEVLVDDTIVREATQGSDGLLGEINGGGTTVLVGSVSDAIDLLVDLGSVMVTVLTSSGNGPLNARWMPGSNTSDLTKTFMGLSGETAGSPTSSHTFETFTLGDADDVDHLILLENARDGDGLLEETESELDLIRDVSSIDLDFHEMSLLLSQVQLADLGVDQQANDGASAADAIEIFVNGLSLPLGSVFLGVLGECHLLGRVPVLVESSSNFFAEMLGPDRRQRAKTLRSINITNKTNSNHRGSFQNSDLFDNFFFVEF